MAIIKRRLELRHLRFADDREKTEHELRERVAYFTSVEVEPTDLVLRDRGTRVEMPVEMLLELLDRLDETEA